MLKTKNYLLLITGVVLCGEAYAQTSNMQLPNYVGVYSANSSNTSQMRLPPQVGMYQRNSAPAYVNPYTTRPRTVVDYSQNPTMNMRLYENVNGYQTPNKYVLQSPALQAQRMGQTQKSNTEMGTEYYLSLGYGAGSFSGEGLTNSMIEPIPLNNISEGLGDPKALHIGFGVTQNRDVRVDVSYTSLSGLKYDSTIYTEEQLCSPDIDNASDDGFDFSCSAESPVSGGGVNVNALMINVQVPLTDLFGPILDNMVVPYIGGGVGFSFNTLSDYTVYPEFGNAEVPETDDGNPEYAGFYQYDGEITHFGAMTSNFAWAVEAGVSINIDRKTILDLYYRITNYGTIKSKDYSYYDWSVIDIVDPDNNGNCTSAATAEGFVYEDEFGWCESEEYSETGYETGTEEKGKIETQEIGVKLRLMF